MFRYNCLLLDLDGTLLDFDRAEHAALMETLGYFALPQTAETVERYGRINTALWRSLERGEIKQEKLVRVRFSMLLSQLDREGDGGVMNAYYLKALSHHGETFEGVREFLEMVEDGCTLAVASNGVKKTQEGRLAVSGLAPFFDAVIISEDVGASKPAKKFFTTALNVLGITHREKVLMVGDNLTADIGGAAKCGLDSCWFNPAQRENTGSIQPTYTVANYEELARIVMGEEEWLCRSEKQN